MKRPSPLENKVLPTFCRQTRKYRVPILPTTGRQHFSGGFRLTILMILTLAFAAGAAESEGLKPVADPKPLLRELQTKMAAQTSIYLEFTQERQLALFAEPLKSEGVMLIDRPDEIRWETTAPYQSILLGNHKSVAQFERTDGQWKKLKLGFPQMLKRVMDQMTSMHQGKMDGLTNEFTVTVSTGSVTQVKMEPRDKNIRAMLASIEVKMRPDFSATLEVVMNEPGGDLTRIIFHREKRGMKFPPGTFDQTKPLDVAAVKAAVGDGQ